jgi:hypothetical protein
MDIVLVNLAGLDSCDLSMGRLFGALFIGADFFIGAVLVGIFVFFIIPLFLRVFFSSTCFFFRAIFEKNLNRRQY